MVTDLFVDVGREQASSEFGVVGFFNDQTRGGADRQFVEFLGGGAVGERGNGACRHDHGVDAVQTFGGSGDCVDDFVDVNGF